MEDNDINAILERRKKNFQNMGVMPTFTPEQVMEAQQTSVHGAGKNLGVRDRIMAIKNGGMKDIMREYNNAKNPQEFQSIPEFKPKPNIKDPRYQQHLQEKSENMNKLGLTQTSKKNDLNYIDAMFESDGGSYSGDVIMGNAWNERRQNAQPQTNSQPPVQQFQEPPPLVSDRLFDSGGSWDVAFKQKLQESQKVAQPTQQHQQPVYQQNNNTSNDSLLLEIERMINKSVNEKIVGVIKEVMSLNINKNEKTTTNENTFKRVKNKQGELIEGVIAIGDKFYRLEEIELKRKS